MAPESGQGVTGWREGRAERAATRAPKEVGIIDPREDREKGTEERNEEEGKKGRGGGEEGGWKEEKGGRERVQD